MLIDLLNCVNDCLNCGKSLTDAFVAFAKLHGFSVKSVKKCFDSVVDGFKRRPHLAKKLDVDLDRLTNPANAFNMAAVNAFIQSNGNANKCLYTLCLGDKEEISALFKRLTKFYPQYKTADVCKEKPQRCPPSSSMRFALDLQMRTCVK